MSSSPQSVNAEILAAFSGGRLSLAEIVGVQDAELAALLELARARVAARLFDEAAVLVRGALALFPYEPGIWELYARVLAELGRADQAARAARAATVLRPQAAAEDAELSRNEPTQTMTRMFEETTRTQAPALRDEITRTALVRRRGGEPLLGEDE